jgi:hypothetical protein
MHIWLFTPHLTKFSQPYKKVPRTNSSKNLCYIKLVEADDS